MADRQIEPIQVLREVLENGESITSVHQFYEFVYIGSGSGSYFNHQVKYGYQKGDLYVIKPNEEHAFHPEERTVFLLLRYTEQARLVMKELVDNSNGRAIGLSKAKSPVNSKIRFGELDEKLVVGLFLLLQQLCAEPLKNENLCYYQVLCMISIIERNLNYLPNKDQLVVERESIARILRHIHKHLSDPEMLSLTYIATKFTMSNNRLGSYFKKETGQSVKQYIDQCRLELIGQKVAKSELSFSEIGYQFGFVDESHFYKVFKKFYGMSPTAYRRTYQASSAQK